MRSRNLIAAVFTALICLLLATSPATARILFYDNCEDYPNLTKPGGDWTLFESSGKLSVSSKVKRAGGNSYMIAFQAGASAPRQGKRVELALQAPNVKNFKFEREYWLGYSMYVPSNFRLPYNEKPRGWGMVGQFHKVPKGSECDQDPGPPYHAINQPFGNHFDGTDAAPILRTVITGQSRACQYDEEKDINYPYTYVASIKSPALKKGQWNDIVLHTIFSYNGRGTTEMWLNGEKYIDLHNVTNAHNDPVAPYFQVGLYGTSKFNHILYYDEFRVGDAKSSYKEVAPRK